MKIVLRHKTTGHYYRSPGKWVRRADNALTFDAADAAHAYSLEHHLDEAQAVLRLAPYLIPLLQHPRNAAWDRWLRSQASQWYLERAGQFGRN